MALLTPGSSPAVENTYRKRRGKVVARKAISSALFILFIIMLLCIDMSYSSFSSYIGLAHPVLWYIECTVVIYWLFRLLPSIVYLLSYTKDYFFGDVVILNEEQARLLRVQRNETGFKISPKKQPANISAQSSFFLTASTPVSQTSFASDGSRQSSTSYLSPYSSYMYSPSQHSPTGYHSGSSSTLSASPSNSFDRSLNLSSANTSTTRFDVSDHSGLRSRHNLSYSRMSPASTSDTISDMPTLTRYLKEQEEKERRSLQASPDTSGQGSASFWSYGSSPMDHVNVLRKYQYQVATRSPQSPTAKASSSDQSVSSGVEEENAYKSPKEDVYSIDLKPLQVWGQFGVTEDNLYLWTEKLRRWLSLTVIIKLADEIDKVNSMLRSIGCEDLQVGDVSVATLKQLALTKGNIVPSLNTIIPYLDVSSNQEYIVRRIRDLATGSMSAFTWNSGGNYGKPWGEHLPTDSLENAYKSPKEDVYSIDLKPLQLVMHLLCTYMDSLLPTQPRYPDGKTFTSQHFIKTPDKPVDHDKIVRRDTMCIYQSVISPPHYQVIIGDETFNLPKGRNNMFQSILMFFFYIKEKRGGMLGRVNTGMSGLNIMWIFQ